ASPGAGGMPGSGSPGGLPAQDAKSKQQVQPDLKKSGAGGGGGSPAPSQPAPPTTAPNNAPPPADAPTQQPAQVDPAKAREEQYRNNQEWAEKLARVIQDRSRLVPEKSLKELSGKDQTLGAKPKDTAPPPAKADGKNADSAKGGKADPKKEVTSSTRPTCAAAKPGECPEEAGVSAAEAKAPPVVTPVAVRLGPLRPRWLTAADGTEYLLLVRAATSDQQVMYQGVVVDWPALRATLTALVADLFPGASLVVLREDDDAPAERTMTTLPVRLDTGADTGCPDCGWTPLRFGLVIAWAAALLAIAATAVGGRAVLAMSDRRVRFASAVTHELRTPLTALQLHLDLLTSGLVTDEAKKAEYLTTLSAEVDRLNRLVENVLDFARLEKQSAATAARPVPVADVLADLHRTWADRLRTEGFEFVTEMADPPPAVLADPRVLEQVLGNLIDNARKYAKGAADRRITVRAEAAGPRAAIAVEDHGPGVPAGERRAIFKPFTRGSGATDTGGAGIGLSLAREWAELFCGSLTYHPHPGGGACFRLELPAV
ncbi:MAG: HAMP domain-containing sensor histidine kinase, partial [Gemmataceae bacterium]